jgi:hypothetical protein
MLPAVLLTLKVPALVPVTVTLAVVVKETLPDAVFSDTFPESAPPEIVIPVELLMVNPFVPLAVVALTEPPVI